MMEMLDVRQNAAAYDNGGILSDARLNHAQGALMGLAIGDSVGMVVEFRPKDSFAPIGDMFAGGVFGLQKGQWTDDTSMALCLAESLIAQQSFDPTDQMARYCRWYEHGEIRLRGIVLTSAMPHAKHSQTTAYTATLTQAAPVLIHRVMAR